MVALWFFLVSATFAAYVVLDGYDLGAGILHPFVARTPDERLVVIDLVTPVWDGNEVFLVSAGATLYLAFPPLFAVFASGFYLPIMIVLWLLALRALGIEMRHKLHHPIWDALWDGAFFVGSALLVLFFGAALGNIVRGVSVDEHGLFFAPLWTDGRVGADVGILDWYTVLVGVTAVVVTAFHGANWLAMKTAGAPAEDARSAVHARARRGANWLMPPAIGLAALASASSFAVQPAISTHLAERPWGGALAVVAALGAFAAWFFPRRAAVGSAGHELADRPSVGSAGHARAFAGSTAFVAGLFGLACFGIFPDGLPARDPSRSLHVADVAADSYGLGVALVWWIPGMVLVALWSWLSRRLLRTPDVRSPPTEPKRSPT